MPKAITAENLSKAYQLGDFGTGTISRDVERFFARVRGKEDPYLRIGETNDRAVKGSSDVVWVLKDLNFDIEQGDAIGIIGRNGAGKSTLLKVLSRITSPTTGSIKVKGRIASLLEVGTGFHPELTGKENIYLNGAILGMRKAEIKRRFDEIVNFSGVERYIDTPVKRYSSGMYVRLAFAVAAHLESEILIVDEVLAVGDAEFQKKCLGKMSDVSKGEGRTVLFVSHNMNSVATLCKKGILLTNGEIVKAGNIREVIDAYGVSMFTAGIDVRLIEFVSFLHADLIINKIIINQSEGNAIQMDDSSDSHLQISIEGSCKTDMRLNLELRVTTNENEIIAFYSPAHMQGELIKLGKGNFIFNDKIDLAMLTNGTYYLSITLSYPNVESYLHIENIKLVKNNAQTATGRAFPNNEVGYFIIK